MAKNHKRAELLLSSAKASRRPGLLQLILTGKGHFHMQAMLQPPLLDTHTVRSVLSLMVIPVDRLFAEEGESHRGSCEGPGHAEPTERRSGLEMGPTCPGP